MNGQYSSDSKTLFIVTEPMLEVSKGKQDTIGRTYYVEREMALLPPQLNTSWTIEARRNCHPLAMIQQYKMYSRTCSGMDMREKHWVHV
eukprot:scaffold13344_cov215-Alexandrium_tamarense.AAC.8